MEQPDHLRAPSGTTSAYLAARPLGVAAFVLGIAAFAVAAITQSSAWSTPDWRISVPALAITALAAIGSLARREKAYALWIFGVALAAAATVLGWFLMVAIVIAVAVILILILHSVM